MKELLYTIKDAAGIHARPAGLLVKEAAKFDSHISISKGSQVGDLKRIFSVMALGTKQGEEILITIDGTDEESAFDAIKTVLEENL